MWTVGHVILESIPPRRAMLSAMRRKSHPGSLQPTDTATWLVVRDSINRLVESTQLPPGAELRAALVCARARLIANGWSADEIGRNVSFFFCAREGERHMVGIEYRLPGSGLGAW